MLCCVFVFVPKVENTENSNFYLVMTKHPEEHYGVVII